MEKTKKRRIRFIRNGRKTKKIRNCVRTQPAGLNDPLHCRRRFRVEITLGRFGIAGSEYGKNWTFQSTKDFGNFENFKYEGRFLSNLLPF